MGSNKETEEKRKAREAKLMLKITPAVERLRPTTSKITTAESANILTLKTSGMSDKLIAQAVNRHETAVHLHLKHFEMLFDHLLTNHEYESRKADIFTAAESLALKSLLESISSGEGDLKSRTLAFKEIFNASRLVQNKSTSNRAVMQFTLPADIDTHKITDVTPLLPSKLDIPDK